MATLKKKLTGIGWDDQRYIGDAEKQIGGIIGGMAQQYGVDLAVYQDEPEFIRVFTEKKEHNFKELDFILLDIVQGRDKQKGYRLTMLCRGLGFKKPIFLYSSNNTVLVSKDFFPVHPYMFLSKANSADMIVELIISFLRYNHLSQDKVFIGHGGKSKEWQQLATFLESIDVNYDEFNRTPQPGNSVTTRLLELKENAGLAFVIYSKEDESAEGAERARQNVVHETGYFQSALGYERTILFVEENCQMLSNIDGIMVVKYKTSIMEAQQKILEILRRERFVVKNL